jgi:Peptidase family S41
MASIKKLKKTRSRAPRGKAGGTPLFSPAGKLLATTFALPSAALAAPVYPIADRQRLIDQLTLALRSFYVHLERKKAIYGFDPVRALALLAPKIPTMSDAEFHESLVELLARVRDRHVIFLGRAPYGAAAMVPFTIETCWENGIQLYVVTKLDPGTATKSLQPGARVSHWNGIPIDRYVRVNANLFDGGNEAAALARSLAFLTHRPLNRFGPPLEEWVDLRFTVNGIEADERFSWAGFRPAAAPTYPGLGRNITGFGGDLPLMDLQNARRVRIAPQSFDAAPAAPPAPPLGVPDIQGHAVGGVVDYGTVTTADGSFAYLRFWSFEADSVDDFVNALTPILPTLPQNGLIFDIRGNSGGYIAAGERVLQLFSASPIVPARFEFRVTELTHAMANRSDEFIRWRPSFAEAFATGEDYTRGIPIEGEDADYNNVGRKYLGPVVLVSDALAFSTADIFAAGFIDNGLGKIICIDRNMAAAGANNWRWDAVRVYNPDFRLDAKLKPNIVAGKLTADIVDAFNGGGVSLSKKAKLSAGVVHDGDTIWTIRDGTLTHTIRDQSWMSPDLEVYLDRSLSGLADLPSGIILSLTMRRAVRVKANEGRILEDVGIVPDVLYQMTVRDVMEQNQDLFDRAGKELIAAPGAAPAAEVA